MPDSSEPRHRRSLRLPGYDYSSAGAYFVTLVTDGRQERLSRVVGQAIVPTDEGCVVEATWHGIPGRFPGVRLDAFVLMPNRVHFIVQLGTTTSEGEERGEETSPLPDGPPAPAVGAGSPSPVSLPRSRRDPTLGSIVAWLKYESTKHIDEARRVPGIRLWQRNYYEHVIRDDAELALARAYIAANPARRADDRDP